MALKNYYTKEEHEMQELVQKQIDLAGFGGEGFTEKQVNQIHEYAQMVGDELRVRIGKRQKKILLLEKITCIN